MRIADTIILDYTYVYLGRQYVGRMYAIHKPMITSYLIILLALCDLELYFSEKGHSEN